MEIQIVAPTDYSGYGNLGRGFIRQLWEHGYRDVDLNTNLHGWYGKNVRDESLAPIIHEFSQNKINRPDIYYNLWTPMYIQKKSILAPQILYTMFETSHINQDWVARCNLTESTIVPTKYCYDAFTRSGVNNCKEITHGLDFPDNVESHPSVDKLKGTKFLFQSQWTSRKSAKETLEAFCKTFKKGEATLLIRAFVLDNLGVTNAQIQLDIADTKKAFPDSGQVIILEDYSDTEKWRLLNSVDCLLSASRGEGIGLSPIEALSQGTPIIVSRGTALEEFANDSNAIMINSIESEINISQQEKDEYFFNDPKMRWQNPDFLQLSEMMRYVADNPADVKELAEKGRIDVRAKYDWETCFPKMMNTFGEVIDIWNAE